MNSENGKYIFGFVVFLLIIILVIYTINCWYYNDAEMIITIDEKLIKRSGSDGQEKYLLFVRDENNNNIQLQNTDTLIRMKFNSSEFQQAFKEGNLYKVTVIGHRIGFLSSYKNIIDYEEITKGSRIESIQNGGTNE